MADIKTVQLIVNSEQAKKKLDEINQKLDVAKKKKHDAFLVGDAKGIEVYSKEIKKLETQLKNAQTRGVTIAKPLKDLDKATPNELKSTIRAIMSEMNSGKIERVSKEWEVLNANTFIISIGRANAAVNPYPTDFGKRKARSGGSRRGRGQKLLLEDLRSESKRCRLKRNRVQ